MKEEMGVLTAHEVNKLMRKMSRERARVIREFVTRAYALKIGEEFFQCHLSVLPELEELKRLLETSTMTFCIWQTINGTIVKREA